MELYVVVQTDKGNYAVRPKHAPGVWLHGTPIVVEDKDQYALGIYESKYDAYQNVIRLNKYSSSYFRHCITMDKDKLDKELRTQQDRSKIAAEKIEILDYINELKQGIGE